jgi:spermine oxidase
VIVGCSDGSWYQTDHVIVTVSLGVLKSLGHLFTPKLPLFKQDAINLIGMGTVAKILLKFPVKWWPDDVAGFSFLWTKTDRNSLLKEFPYGPSDHGKSWLEDIYGFYVVDSHPTVLLGWNVGKMVEQVEHLADHILIEGCIFLLKKFLGHRYNVTYPNGLLR